MNSIPPHELWHLGTRLLGKVTWLFSSLQSTNTLALSLASDSEHDGLVILAEEQCAGRGQRGRTWTAPAGSSVLLTALLFPPLPVRRPVLLTAWAAVSVCETIRAVTGLDARIKWPNDVLVEGRKVCGILIEQRNTGSAALPLAAAVGIGLNVTQPADFFAGADLPCAGSLMSLSGKALSTRLLAERLIEVLDEGYTRLLEGDTTSLESAWRERLGLLGKWVILETSHERKYGRLLELTWDGIVLEESGALVHLVPELVRHIVEA